MELTGAAAFAAGTLPGRVADPAQEPRLRLVVGREPLQELASGDGMFLAAAEKQKYSSSGSSRAGLKGTVKRPGFDLFVLILRWCEDSRALCC